MKLVSALSFVSFVALSLSSVACGGADDASGPAEPKVTLAGKVGSGSVGTRSFVGVSTSSGNLHVTAHEVHKRGERADNVEVNVGADGRFALDLSRGSRWIVTVDDDHGGSAIVTFGGRTVIAADKDGDSARVDIGSLSVVGGEARADVTIDGKFGLAATLAAADDVIEAANGAIIAAAEAVEQAQKAAAAAVEAAGDATAAAQAAAEAAKEAARAAGQ